MRLTGNEIRFLRKACRMNGKQVPAIQVEPDHFKRMEIGQPADGQPTPRLVLERVRLKDAARRTKTDEWDIVDHDQLAA